MNTEIIIRELNNVIEKHKNDFVPTFQVNIASMCRDIIPKLEQLAEYETIGTVEECREAMEKQKVKKYERGLDKDVRCPICATFTTDIYEHRYCTYCGQRLE